MILIVRNDAKENVGVIKEIVDIERYDDPANHRCVFKLRVIYNELVWKILRDAKSYYDNDVPEAPVSIDDVKVDIYLPHIIVIGHQKYSDLINIIPEPIYFIEGEDLT